MKCFYTNVQPFKKELIKNLTIEECIEDRNLISKVETKILQGKTIGTIKPESEA